MLPAVNPTQTSCWKKLQAHYEKLRKVNLRTLFEEDAKRFDRFSLQAGPLFLDYSKNHIVADTCELFGRLAEEMHIIDPMTLPELATSSVAAFNRKADLAVGNVIGSNIFNVLMVLAITGIVTKGGLPYDEGYLNLDMYITIGGMALLVVFMYTLNRSKIDRLEGGILLFAFLGYAYLIYTRL